MIVVCDAIGCLPIAIPPWNTYAQNAREDRLQANILFVL